MSGKINYGFGSTIKNLGPLDLEYELGCLARAREWESLQEFMELFMEEQEPIAAVPSKPKVKRRKYEYDWRVACAKHRDNLRR